MKRIVYLMGVAFVLMLALVSCTSADADLSDTITVNQANSITLKKIQEYNQVMLLQHPQTRGTNGGLKIAAHDIVGAFSGINAGKAIAGLLGIATGGTGSAATIIGCGIIGGAAASYKCYRNNKGLTTKIENFYKYSLNIINENLKSDTTNYYIPYMYNPKIIHVKLPKDFETLKDVGEAHNKLLLGSNYSSPSTRATVVRDPVDAKIPPILTLDKEKVKIALNSKDFKNQFDKIISNLDKSTIDGELDINGYFRKNPTGSVRAENAIKEYLKLFTTYPENVDDIIQITNDYINIIESNNEFNDDEKAMIYAGLMVSIYSPQIWDNFK